MGLRFRKSVKIAPGVKINFNKSSVSTTFGGRGASYTVNSKGKKTASVGIPGTGLSYTTTTSEANKSPRREYSSVEYTSDIQNANVQDAPKKKNKKGCLTAIIIWLILGFGCSLFESDTLKTITLTADTETIYDINAAIPIAIKLDPEDYSSENIDWKCTGGKVNKNNNSYVFIADEPGTYEVHAELEDLKSNTISFIIEDKSTLDEETESTNDEEIQQDTEADIEQSSTENSATTIPDEQEEATSQEPLVWITSSGKRYHNNSSCSNMKNPSQITQSSAEAQGKTPCKKCY